MAGRFRNYIHYVLKYCSVILINTRHVSCRSPPKHLLHFLLLTVSPINEYLPYIDGLVQERRQDIVWTNAEQIDWRINAALGGYELNKCW